MRRLILSVLALAAFPAALQAAPAEQSVLVATAPVAQGTLDQTIVAYGVTQAAPAATLNLSMPHAGQVLHLGIVAGQRVRAGDPLFDFGAEPAVTLAYQQALSALVLARQEKAHIATLAAQKLATQSQLDQAEKAVRDAAAALEEQERLGGGKAAEKVAAPFAGVVTMLAVANGDHVQANTTVLRLAEADRLEAILGVEPEDAARVAPEMPVRLTALAQPATPLDATVRAVGGQLDARTQLIDVVVPIPAGGRAAILPGEHVSGEIEVGRLSGWIVPRQAVLTDRDGAYVFQVAEGKAVRIGVAVLGESGDRAAIDGPLQPERKLVVAGNYELSDGMAVREAAEAKSGGGTAEKAGP
jgi:membrane fusion protein, multidrug efflux system